MAVLTHPRVLVVGAGPAGLSTAVALKDEGAPAVVLDRAEDVGAAWRARYDVLRLNTWRRFSHPPGRPFPSGTPTFPTRDEVVSHLERLAGEDGVQLRLGTRVDRVDRHDGGWRLETSAGTLAAEQVVIATGYESVPVVPAWPGRDDFGGELLHSSQYRNAAPFRGRSVLVVGPGCSGMEIASDLAQGGAAEVLLSVRTPPNILLRQGPGPVPGDLVAVTLWHVPTRVADAVARFAQRMDVGDLSEYGLRRAEEGVFSRARRLGVAPTIVDHEVVHAIRARRIVVVPAVEAFDRGDVVLAGGARVTPDAVVCATGFRTGLEPLVGHLGVLDVRGVPRTLGRTPAAPGLRFVGFVPRPGGLGYMGREARHAARAIARELRQPPVALSRR